MSNQNQEGALKLMGRWRPAHQQAGGARLRLPLGAAMHAAAASDMEPLASDEMSADVSQAVEDVGAEVAPANVASSCGLAVVGLLGDASEVELFHTPDGESYASVATDGHRETLGVNSRGMRDWLRSEWYRETQQPISSQQLRDIIATFAAQAKFGGVEKKVFTRIGEQDGVVYVDRGSAEWDAVAISPDGVTLCPAPEVKFRRSRSALSLPRPKRGGSVNELRQFINCEDDDSWVLTVAWLLGALCPRGPYPIDVAFGEQGTAKSTRTRILRRLIDPHVAATRCEPRSVPDLVLAASHSWALAFDNLSCLKDSLSDAFCRLATGGGFGTRKLYTDDEEMVFDVMRPLILNGIEELATRGDLLDRAIIHHLPVISPQRRIPEQELWQRFEEAEPRILGALYEAVSMAIRNLPSTVVERPPRMADFARWVTAAEPALGWQPGTFLQAYRRNMQEARLLALETSPLFAPLCDFMQRLAREGVGIWEGTATALLAQLERRVAPGTKDRMTWPRNPQSLSNKLRRLAPNLRGIQVELEFIRELSRQRTRTIRLNFQDAQALQEPSNPGKGGLPQTQNAATAEQASQFDWL